jgi:hypothetical protein
MPNARSRNPNVRSRDANAGSRYANAGSRNPNVRSRDANARSRDANAVGELRLAIDCLPVKTREAMLDGVLCSPRIIVGAYTDDEGGVCPMLAAHRRGGRTSFLSFARSWDRYTRARRRRRATPRELSTLVALLRASLLDEEHVDLARAIDEHAALRARRERIHREERARSRVTPGPGGEIVARRLRAPRWLGRRRERMIA